MICDHRSHHKEETQPFTSFFLQPYFQLPVSHGVIKIIQALPHFFCYMVLHTSAIFPCCCYNVQYRIGIVFSNHHKLQHFPAHHAEHLAAVHRLAEAGVLRPAIGARYPLAQAKDALAAMARREVTGKIVVTIAPTRP